MKHLSFVAFLAVVTGGQALACDDHHGTCEIEDWRHIYTPMMQSLVIEGVTTCDIGIISLRLYDGDGDDRQFVGVETAYIEGHIFKTIRLPVENPDALSIKYSIQPE